MHLQYETNIDDMDPRLWPNVIDKLLHAGAQDAWVTPITMKKGRPAFTLGVLCLPTVAEAVRATIFRETTTLGIREVAVTKWELDREDSSVEVRGQTIRMKTGLDTAGVETNVSVEWDDVMESAEALGLSAKEVLAAATAAATLRSSRSAGGDSSDGGSR